MLEQSPLKIADSHNLSLIETKLSIKPQQVNLTLLSSKEVRPHVEVNFCKRSKIPQIVVDKDNRLLPDREKFLLPTTFEKRFDIHVSLCAGPVE